MNNLRTIPVTPAMPAMFETLGITQVEDLADDHGNEVLAAVNASAYEALKQLSRAERRLVDHLDAMIEAAKNEKQRLEEAIDDAGILASNRARMIAEECVRMIGRETQNRTRAIETITYLAPVRIAALKATNPETAS